MHPDAQSFDYVGGTVQLCYNLLGNLLELKVHCIESQYTLGIQIHSCFVFFRFIVLPDCRV